MVIGIILFVIAAVLFWLGPLCTEKEKEKEKELFGQAIFLAHQHYIEDLIPSLNIYFSIVVNNTLFGLAPFEKAGSNEILVNLQYTFPPKLGAMALATGLQNLVQEMFNRRFELPDNYPAALSNTLKDINTSLSLSEEEKVKWSKLALAVQDNFKPNAIAFNLAPNTVFVVRVSVNGKEEAVHTFHVHLPPPVVTATPFKQQDDEDYDDED